MLVCPKYLNEPVKNPFWDDKTPNEYFDQNEAYRQKLTQWGYRNQLKRVNRMFLVRITKQKSELDLEQSSRWWDDPTWMEKCFWVFTQPVPLWVGNSKLSCYALEYFECQRVKNAAIRLFGFNPFSKTAILPDGIIRQVANPEPSLLVPVHCCGHAWDETSNGYSDHLRHDAAERAAKKLSQEQIDRDGLVREEVEKKMQEVINISNNREWITKKNPVTSDRI